MWQFTRVVCSTVALLYLTWNPKLACWVSTLCVLHASCSQVDFSLVGPVAWDPPFEEMMICVEQICKTKVAVSELGS